MSMTGGYIQQREFVLPSTVGAGIGPAKKHRIHIKSAPQSLPQLVFIIIIYRLASTQRPIHDSRAPHGTSRLNFEFLTLVAAQRCPERTMVAPSPT